MYLQLIMETWGPVVAIGKLATAPMQAGTMMGGSGQVKFWIFIHTVVDVDIGDILAQVKAFILNLKNLIKASCCK